MRLNLRNIVAKSLMISLIAASGLVHAQNVLAASATSLSDNMSRLKASTASNHEIKFVTPSGVAAAGTITLTFSADFTGVSSIAFGDVDFATGSSSNCTSATFTEQALAATPSGSTWGIGSSGQTVTLTSGTGTVTADTCVRFKIGTNASTGTAGTNQITNGAIDDDDTITIGGTFGDTGTISVDIITDDQVVVTATVDPSLTFSISDNTIGFGTLSASDDRFATGDTLGNSSATSAHTIAAGTNATSGYVIYLLGGTLTSGGNTITAPAGPAATTVGSEQFGLNLSASGGSGTVDSQYGTSSQYGFGSTSTTQDNVASASGASASTTYTATYIANIAAATEAGSYSTTLTYTATATY
jgi:hypothetical protein